MTLIGPLWRGAVARTQIRHIDPTCYPELEVIGDVQPDLFIAVRQARDTLDQEKRFDQLVISTVHLRYWPGDTLAEMWLAAAWSGYITHEALELVTVNGVRPLDPHRSPFCFDRGLRCGYPVDLTPETLEQTLALVMDAKTAAELVANRGVLP